MSHLERDVAAFVDGQLSPEATTLARAHLADCARCREAVAQQRLLKSRMQTGAVPGPPPELLASLSSLASAPLPQETRRQRWRRSPWLGVGSVLVGASALLVVLAFVAGAHEERLADPVSPVFDDYASDFVFGHTTAAGTLTVEALDDLDAQGWPCHPDLAGDLERVDGRWYGEDTDVVSLTYTDGRHRLRLFEKTGTLDDAALDGFTSTRVGDRRVWLREGEPTVVTWDADGIVFVAVTDVDRDRLGDVLDDLPAPREPRGATDRMSDGLDRMTAWVSP